MKVFNYSKISFFRGVHNICVQYVKNKIDFAVVFTKRKDIEFFQSNCIVPISQSEALISFRLFKFMSIYNCVWALSEPDEIEECTIDLALSADKNQLTVYFRWQF